MGLEASKPKATKKFDGSSNEKPKRIKKGGILRNGLGAEEPAPEEGDHGGKEKVSSFWIGFLESMPF